MIAAVFFFSIPYYAIAEKRGKKKREFLKGAGAAPRILFLKPFFLSERRWWCDAVPISADRERNADYI